MTDKQPEDWEAGEHIDNLKKGMDITATSVCQYHGDQTRAIIWMIRHMEKTEKNRKETNVMLKLGKVEIPVSRAFSVIDLFVLLIFIMIARSFLLEYGLIGQ